MCKATGGQRGVAAAGSASRNPAAGPRPPHGFGEETRQPEDLLIRELLDADGLAGALFNGILGPSAICCVCRNQIRILLANERYRQMAGPERTGNHILDRVGEDCRRLFRAAYESRPAGAEGTVRWPQADGQPLRAEVLFLREQAERRLFCVSFADVTVRGEEQGGAVPRFRPPAANRGPKQPWLDQCYGALPCGYGLFRINPEPRAEGCEVLYVNREMERMCDGEVSLLLRQDFGEDLPVLRQRARQAAFQGDACTCLAYSAVSRRCYQFTLYQHCWGCFGCLMQDVT